MCPDTDFPRVSLYGTIILFHEIIIRGVCHAILMYGCNIELHCLNESVSFYPLGNLS